MPPRRSARARQREAKRQGNLFREQLAQAANDVLSNGIIEDEDDIEETQTSQTGPALDGMTSAGSGSTAQVRNIPVTKARNWEADMRTNRVEHPRPVGLQSSREPAELKHAQCSQDSRLEPPTSHPTTSPPPTAMAGKITMTQEEFGMLVKHEVLKALVQIGANDDTISKAVDKDWTFADEDTEQTRKTSAESATSSASDAAAVQEKTAKGKECTTSTQGYAEDPSVQKFHVKVAELRKMLSEKKTEVFEPKFEEASGEMEIQLPPNVKNLDHWGTAVVQQGKYQGQKYKTVFDDAHYKEWLMARCACLKHPAMVDLAKYVICRAQAETDRQDGR